MGNVLDSKFYELKTISIVLEAVGMLSFSPDNILKIRSYVQTLSQDMDFMAAHIPPILQVYRKNPQLNSILKEHILNLPDISQ